MSIRKIYLQDSSIAEAPENMVEDLLGNAGLGVIPGERKNIEVMTLNR